MTRTLKNGKKMADNFDLVCCSCNELKRLCKGCTCVKSGHPCSNCLPDRTGCCHNRFGQSHLPSSETSVPEAVDSSGVAPSSPSQSTAFTLSSLSRHDSVSSSHYQDSDLGSMSSSPDQAFDHQVTDPSSSSPGTADNIIPLPAHCELTETLFTWGSLDGPISLSLINKCMMSWFTEDLTCSASLLVMWGIGLSLSYFKDMLLLQL